MENNTWILIDLPSGCKPVSYKWIFKKKLRLNDIVYKHKIRVVVKGFTEQKDINFFDTYFLVARIFSIKIFLALAFIHNMFMHQIDVKIAFHNGDLEEEIYMDQQKGFIAKRQENKVCKLVKSLYGLKQAPK